MKRTEIAVIGGGASGLAAAINAARLGRKVVILEAQNRVGRKLLATGNGRCNIANTLSDKKINECYRGKNFAPILMAAPLSEVIDFLKSVGISLRQEADGRLYPRSEQASAVLDLLRLETESLGIETICDARVNSIEPHGDHFNITYDGGVLESQKVIAAFGGAASPQLGGCEDGYTILKKLGHKASSPKPSLLPLLCSSKILRSLKGVRIHCDISLVKSGKVLRRESGELQFTENALSGIAVFQLSSVYARTGGDYISVDVFPEYSTGSLFKLFSDMRSALKKLPAGDFLSGLVNKRVAQSLIKQVSPLDLPSGKLSDIQLKKLASISKDWQFDITVPADWKQAQVTSGGVFLDQFDSRLESRLVPGLYACGELLDCDGDCGGYNLRWAWSSGIIAGRSAAEGLK